MSDIQEKIALILDGFRRGHVQHEESVDLLESYFRTLPAQAHAEFFETLWLQFRSERISHLTGQRTAHAVIVRAWAAFGPADSLPNRLFSSVDWNDANQSESWAIVVGSEFVHSLWTHRERFSKAAVDVVKAQCALFTDEQSAVLVGARFPEALVKLAERLNAAVEKITLERNLADIPRSPHPAREAKDRNRVPKNASTSKYGRWRIIRSLPEGGQAHVFIVEDTKHEFSGAWALKRLKNIDDQARRTRFEREIRAVQSVEHPNVLKVVDSDLNAERPYFVAEYCAGGSMQDAGASRFKGQMQAVSAILLQIVEALVAVHKKGPIHRDIKPANILIRANRTPVIGDFGICFIEEGERVTLSGEGVGSRNFIAPEMESGQHDLGAPTDRTDVYSLGKVIYWMLSGGREFSREDHRKGSLVDLFNDQRCEHVHRLLDQMVVREPQKRIHSHELKEKIEMTASLVQGNFAPLSPSIGIRCRFCGIGKYSPYACKSGFQIPKVGLTIPTGFDIRVLTCSHCGHIEWFQFGEIENPGWWEQ